MFLSDPVRFEIGLSSRRTLVKAITLGQSLALQEIAIVGCNSRWDARRNERSRVKSTPPQRSPGTADANRDYHGRPRRPLRGTSHLDSGAGPAGSTHPFLLRPTFPSRVRFVSFPYPSSRVSRWKERSTFLATIVRIAATEDSPK